MRKILFLIVTACVIKVHAQTASDSVKLEARQIYLQGLHYKNGNGIPMDYVKAYDLFVRLPKSVMAKRFMRLRI